MSPWTSELSCLAGCGLLAAGTVGLARTLGSSPALRRALAEHRDALAHDLRLLGWRLDARAWLAAQACGAATCLFAALVFGRTALVLCASVPLVLPRAWLRRERARRVARIEEQIDGWLVLLSNALKATPALAEAVASTVELVEPPLRSELDLVTKEQRLGAPLDDALTGMAMRVRSRVLSSTVVALRIARRTGGDLHRMLERSAASLRELARVEAVVRTRTAEGRAQSMLVAVLPAPLLLVLEAIDPQFLAPLFESTRGHLVLGAAALLWVAALAWARRIVAVDV